MIRILLLLALAAAAGYLVMRYSPGLRRRAATLMNNPFVRQVVVSAALRALRFLILRR